MQAKVVGAAFEKRGLYRPADRLCRSAAGRGDRAGPAKRFGAGGDDGFPAAKERRQEVGECLAGTRPASTIRRSDPATASATASAIQACPARGWNPGRCSLSGLLSPKYSVSSVTAPRVHAKGARLPAEKRRLQAAYAPTRQPNRVNLKRHFLRKTTVRDISRPNIRLTTLSDEIYRLSGTDSPSAIVDNCAPINSFDCID